MNDRIVIDPKICHGKPVIRGTGTPVAIIEGSLAGGMTFEEIQWTMTSRPRTFGPRAFAAEAVK